MRLEYIKISNYGSLKEIELHCHPLTIFIGRNGQGKSLILEAIYRLIKDFNVIGGGSTLNVADTLWFQRDTGVPIEFSISLVLNDKELGEILPFDEDIIKQIKDGDPTNYNVIKINRKLTFTENWKTLSIEWAGIKLVENDISSSLEDVQKNIGQFSKKLDTEGEEELVLLFPPIIDTETLQKLTTTMLTIREKIKLIPAARDNKGVLGQRIPLIDAPIIQGITSTSNSRIRQDEIKWEEFRSKIEDLIHKRLEPNPSEILIKEGNLGLTVGICGGGDQSLLGLMWETQDKNVIYEIEEPENHLYPKKQKELYDHFIELSKDTQIFICTHSPIMASRYDISGVYLVSKDDMDTTQVEEINENNVERIISELGIRASFQLDYDNVVFVEGIDDVEIFSALSERLIKNGESVGFIDAEGWNNMNYYANAKILTSKSVDIGVYIIFDGDTELEERNMKIKEKLLKELNINEEDVYTLSKNSIEDYLLKARPIYRAFPTISTSRTEISNFIQKNKNKKNKKRILDQILKQGGIGKYNGRLGAQIMRAMTDSEIDDELKQIMKSIMGKAKPPKSKGSTKTVKKLEDNVEKKENL